MTTEGPTTTTGPAGPGDLVRRYAAAANRHDHDALDRLLAEHLVDHHLPPGLPAGRAGAKAWLAALHAAFELQIDVHDVIEAGDRVAVRATARGTHVGEFAGMAPTGRSFEAAFHSVERIEDGRIAERWEVFDTAAMLAQLAG